MRALMKHHAVPVLVASVISLCAGCSQNGSDVRVVSAVYGEYTNFADVTYRVRDMVRSDTEFDVHPNFLKADPFVGYNKVLVIVYDVHGQEHVFTAYEGDTVTVGRLMEAARQ